MSLRVACVGICWAVIGGSGAEAAEPSRSEVSVSKAADWLVAHQLPDGGWSFNHAATKTCDGKCSHAGSLVDVRNAPTALAVLALLSAGEGDKDARHAKELRSGLTFLAGQLKERAIAGGKTQTFEEPGGTMYSHGLATLALCEGFRATGDMTLREAGQKAINHIVYAQDPVGGGWRYTPRQTGDTCISGWQISALVSGRGSMFETPADTFVRANAFLDSVQSAEGAKYGYTGPGAGPSTTASGLLNRRRLGWKADHAAFRAGIEHLTALGPQKSNLYFNLFATAAVRQADEESWKSWQAKLSPLLVESQATEGHTVGSWAVGGDHGLAFGGRLYCTAFAAMTLSMEQGKLLVFQK